MRLLLDESVPRRLSRALPDHEVKTVVEMGWSGIKNGELLALAASGFDALITVDKNLPYQQNLTKLALAVVVLDAPSNEISHLLLLVPKLEQTLKTLSPCTFVRVGDQPFQSNQ